MQTLFCTDCGHKMSYTGAKPKFCSSCGASIGGAPKPQEAAVKKKATRRISSFREQMGGSEEEYDAEEDISEGTDIDYVPDIQKLQYTISNDGVGNKTYNLSELLDVSSEEEERVAPKPKARRGRPRKKSS